MSHTVKSFSTVSEAEMFFCQTMFNYCTIALISHPNKVMLKILQARLQQYVNWELPDVQTGFRRQRNPRSNCQYLTCFLRNLYAGQEATLRTGHGIMDWFKIGKGVHQGCILSPCLFNLYAEYIMWNATLDESQAGIKTARRNNNNLRYADNATLKA